MKISTKIIQSKLALFIIASFTFECKRKVIIIRNPNGYGSVVKLSGNRRKPYCARKTTGWNDKGHPIYKVIGYYAKKYEAMVALAEYNRNPFDIDLAKITLKELFEKWSERDFKKMSNSSISHHKMAFKYAKPLYNIPYKNIKAFQMQEIIDNCGHGYSTQGAIKNFFVQLDKFALELDIILKSNSSLISRAPTEESHKIPFSDDEIEKLWKHSNVEWVDSILFLLYTGFRINEMLTIKIENVDLSQMTITGGLKTKAGKNRIVPIHPKIQKFVLNRFSKDNEFLFGYVTANMYYPIWRKLMKEFNIKHSPHECRHTFRSKLDSAGGNKKCIDLLMGHTSKDIGERVYTHKTIDDLRNTIFLLN